MGSMVLQNTILPLSLLRDRARKDLVEELDKMRGSKALVMDRSLSGPLGLIAEKQLIKDHGVEKTYHLRCASTPCPSDPSVPITPLLPKWLLPVIPQFIPRCHRS